MSPKRKQADSSNVSPAEVQKYLSGINYPTNIEDLISTAESNGATDEVLDIIKKMPDLIYGGPQDVMKAYGEVK